jgi:hypothetical protein
MEESVGPVSTCRREPLRGWWRPIGLKMSFMIFTASVWNILDTPSYITTKEWLNRSSWKVSQRILQKLVELSWFSFTSDNCNAL